MIKKLYWDRRPGIFVEPCNGEKSKIEYKFNGTVQEWYETLVTLIKDYCGDMDVIILNDQSSAYYILQACLEWKPYFEDNSRKAGSLLEMPVFFNDILHDDEIVLKNVITDKTRTIRILSIPNFGE